MAIFKLCEACIDKLKAQGRAVETPSQQAQWWSTALKDAHTCLRLQQEQQQACDDLGQSDFGPQSLTKRGIRPNFSRTINSLLTIAVIEEMGGTITVIKTPNETPKR